MNWTGILCHSPCNDTDQRNRYEYVNVPENQQWWTVSGLIQLKANDSTCVYRKAHFIAKTSATMHALPSSFEIRHMHFRMFPQCVPIWWCMAANCASLRSINMHSNHMPSQRFLMLCPGEKKKKTWKKSKNWISGITILCKCRTELCFEPRASCGSAPFASKVC